MQSEESLRVLIRERLASAAHCVACQGVRSHPVAVALVASGSMPVVLKVARQPRSSTWVSWRS
jgi:hypothetical protein